MASLELLTRAARANIIPAHVEEDRVVRFEQLLNQGADTIVRQNLILRLHPLEELTAFGKFLQRTGLPHEIESEAMTLLDGLSASD